MTMKWVMLTQIRPGFKAGKDVFPLHSGTYDHNVWSRMGLSGSGHFAQGFGAILPEHRPALRWLYERLFQAADEAAGAPCDTVSAYPHRAILALVNWPFDEPARNPGDVLPRAVEDRCAGHYMFRNRWQDENDIIVDALLKNSKGHYGVSAGGIIVWGLGEKTKFPVRVSGEPKKFAATPHGGAVSTSAGAFGVDFSRTSGADALLVLAGPVRGTIKPQQKGKVAVAQVNAASGKTFVVMTLSADGEHPEARADGENLRVGKQTVSYDGTTLVWSTP
jgi:hypothetical protein